MLFRGILLGLFLSVLSWGAFATELAENLLERPESFQVPFRDGERLGYRVFWKPPKWLGMVPPARAGEIEISISESTYGEHETYTIQASAKSSGWLSQLAKLSVDDYFESTIDRDSLLSYRFYKRERRESREKEIEIRFDYASGQILFRQKESPSGQITTSATPFGKVQQPARLVDVLSAFYVVRARVLEPGDRYTIHLNEQKPGFRPIEIRALGQKKRKTFLKMRDTLEIATTEGLFGKGGKLRMWYSKDHYRLPVHFEASASVGKIHGQLVLHETPQFSRSLVETD